MRSLLLVEWPILIAILYAIGLIVDVLFDVLSFSEFIWFGGICLVGALGIPLCSILYSATYFGPGIHQSMYNPFLDVIEFHIGRTHDEKIFLKQSLRVRRVARRFNKDIIFYTNHYSTDRLTKMFGANLHIERVNQFHKVLYYIPYKIVTIGLKEKATYPLVKCILKTPRRSRKARTIA